MANKEIKGNLARLLATENLVVEHKQTPTAYFNVDTRVLVLPKWDKASDVVYDMLVGCSSTTFAINNAYSDIASVSYTHLTLPTICSV